VTTPQTQEKTGSRAKLVLTFLVLAQFLMTLDSTVMNVSIASLVEDLDTTVSGVQGAITLYTLVMASFMLAGGKLGDVWGRLRTYRIGLLVYAVGSTITAFAPNLGVLIFGWSFMEGLGAVLIMPAVAALIAGNFEGKKRAGAFAAVAAGAAAAAAVGPIIGGFVTTVASWRYVFIAEAILCIVIFFGAKLIKDSPVARKPKFDFVGAVLSALSLGLIVLGVLMSSSWGWIRPRGPDVNGEIFAPLNISLTFWMIFLGLIVLRGFFGWIQRREDHGQDPLLTPGLLGIPQLRSGLGVWLLQMLVTAGLLFVLPLYLSVVLGMSALETGWAIFPLSVALILAAIGTPKLFPNLSPRRAIQAGLLLLSGGTAYLAGQFDPVDADGLTIPLIVIGFGMGLVASQIGNIIISSVPHRLSSEAGGLQYTAQNLGASLGTALLGALLIGGLAGSVTQSLQAAPAFEGQFDEQDAIALQANVEFLSDEQLEEALAEGDLTDEQEAAVREANVDGRIDALRRAVGVAALFPLIGLFLTGGIPNKPLAHAEGADYASESEGDGGDDEGDEESNGGAGADSGDRAEERGGGAAGDPGS
jgi:MFS family permease